MRYLCSFWKLILSIWMVVILYIIMFTCSLILVLFSFCPRFRFHPLYFHFSLIYLFFLLFYYLFKSTYTWCVWWKGFCTSASTFNNAKTLSCVRFRSRLLVFLCWIVSVFVGSSTLMTIAYSHHEHVEPISGGMSMVKRKGSVPLCWSYNYFMYSAQRRAVTLRTFAILRIR